MKIYYYFSILIAFNGIGDDNDDGNDDDNDDGHDDDRMLLTMRMMTMMMIGGR